MIQPYEGFMKNLLDDMKNYGRFAFGLRDFLHRRISPAEAQAIVQRRMIERDTNFLRLMERGIFGDSKSELLLGANDYLTKQ